MGAEEIIKKLDETADKLTGDPTVEVASDEQEVSLETVDEQEPLSEPEPSPYVEEAPVQAKPQRTNWKKRFTNYKSSTDGTIHDLRSENLRLKDTISSLQGRLGQVESLISQSTQNQDPFQGVFTAEEEEAFGDEGIAVIKKAVSTVTDRKISPLQAELNAAKEQQRKDFERQLISDKQREYNEFLTRVETLAPSFRDYDSDHGFLQWLEGVDDGSVEPRGAILRRAEAARIPETVASFFNRYTASLKPNDLDRHISPVTTSGTEQPIDNEGGNQNKGLLSEAFIKKFYDDFARGRYVNDRAEAEKIEKKIDNHYAILMNRQKQAQQQRF